MNESKIPLIFIVGPTATGKSSVALELAQKNQFEIVNADSLQVYKELDIGTAKPTQEEQSLVPHHLFNVVDVGQTMTAGDYRKSALEVISAAEQRGVKSLVFVGGSGFYIQALQKGMFDAPKVSEETRRKVECFFEAEGAGKAYERLCAEDPIQAEKISPNDHYRIQRALEVFEETGETLSRLQSKFQPEVLKNPHRLFGLKVDRETLRQRVTLRAAEMLRTGLKEEVIKAREKLKAEGLEMDWAPLRSVGYLQMGQFLDGELAEDQLLESIVTATMQLAKKQMTWFRNRTETVWYESGQDLLYGVESFLESL